MKIIKNCCQAALLLTASMMVTSSMAAPFEIAVTPSRFEVAGDSGKRIAQSIELQNVGSSATDVGLRTLDWDLAANGQVTYYDELRPNSCREWVTLERDNIRLAPKNKKNFRFQIDIPADAPQTECRFMLAVEGIEPAHQTILKSGSASLSLPVSGRIAVAVYVALNGAQPQLKMTQVAVKNIQGKRTPVVVVANQGNAHGRLQGSLEATDAQGNSLELNPDGTPILPGQTRTLALTATAKGGKAAALAFPLTTAGTLDWELGSFKVDAQFK